MLKKILGVCALTMMLSATCMAAWVPFHEENGDKYSYNDETISYPVQIEGDKRTMRKNLIVVENRVELAKDSQEHLLKLYPDVKDVKSVVYFIMVNKEADDGAILGSIVLDKGANVVKSENQLAPIRFEKESFIGKLAVIVRDYEKTHAGEMEKKSESNMNPNK